MSRQITAPGWRSIAAVLCAIGVSILDGWLSNPLLAQQVTQAPQTSSAADVPNGPLGEPSAELLAAARSAMRIQVEVNQSWGEATNMHEDYGAFFADRGWFGCVGLELVDSSTELALVIDVRGEPIKVHYDSGGDRYTSASVEGSVALRVPGLPEYRATFQKTKEPSKRMIIVTHGSHQKRDYTLPEHAPFPREALHATAGAVLGKVFGIECVPGTHTELLALSAEALGRIGGPHVVEPLLNTLKNGRVDQKKAAARALGMVGDRRAVEPLLANLNDTPTDVQLEVIAALGQIGDPRAIEPLIRRLQRSEGPYVVRRPNQTQKAANEALESITGQRFTYQSRAQYWWEKHRSDYEIETIE